MALSEAIEFQGTTLEIASGSGGAKNITAITKGAVTKVTSTAHGLSVGDVVAFASIGGMVELNGVSAMIVAKETDAMYFAIDSSAYTSYTSGGTATPVAWTKVGEITDVNGPDGQASVFEVTHSESTAKEKKMGLPDEGKISLSLNLVPGNTGQQAMRAARKARTSKAFRLTLSDGTVLGFIANVLSFAIQGSVDNKMAASTTLDLTGPVDWSSDT